MRSQETEDRFVDLTKASFSSRFSSFKLKMHETVNDYHLFVSVLFFKNQINIGEYNNYINIKKYDVQLKREKNANMHTYIHTQCQPH